VGDRISDVGIHEVLKLRHIGFIHDPAGLRLPTSRQQEVTSEFDVPFLSKVPHIVTRSVVVRPHRFSDLGELALVLWGHN